MCRLLGVKRSGFYHNKQHVKPQSPLHLEILDWIKKVASSSNYSYGSRRMKKALNALGYPMSRNKAKKLMLEAGVKARCRKKYKVTTNSNHKLPVFDNVLNRQFVVEKINQAYVGDITYIWTNEGWLYLAVVIDLYSTGLTKNSLKRKVLAVH
jgi:putative transposase